MKITVFNGSPWGESGNTHIMVEEFGQGAGQAGAKFQNFFLAARKIQPCTECGTCFFKTPGKCILKDDMSEMINRFMDSDIVVFATPVFMDNVTALMKIFIDRLMPVLEPHYEKDSNGEYRRRGRYKKYPKFVVISSCAMPEQSNFEVLRLYFRRMARTMHTEVVGEIYLAAAGLMQLSEKELRFRPMVNSYKEMLRAAGKELVETGGIGPDMAGRLEQPLVDSDEYVKYANKMWDQLLAERRTPSLVASR
ncbi:MAG: flavodoxin family protein [Phycisphaerae bacterium]|jgi:multimeric flavodoxin WrbA